MTQPDEMPEAESKDVLAREVVDDVAIPPNVAHGGATRKGHSNGLRVHSIVFGAISLVVLVLLGVALMVIAGGRM